jgi:hypothetical protein
VDDPLHDVRQALTVALRQSEVRYVGGIPEGATASVAGELLDAMLPALWSWKTAKRLPEGGGSTRD